MDPDSEEIEILHLEINVLRRRMRASIKRQKVSEGDLIDVLKDMIRERQERIRQIERRSRGEPRARVRRLPLGVVTG
jgi:hypothetical protein